MIKNKDIHGNTIPERNIPQMYRMRKLHKKLRISGTGERNLAFALSELDRESSKLGIPRDIREDAALIYRRAAKNNIVRGRSIEGMVAASIYTACRVWNVPRTLDEISEVSRITKKKIGKYYRLLARELKIKLRPTSPADYVPRFASKLGLSGQAESKALMIIDKTKEKGLITGREPTGIAAASLYIASVFLGERNGTGIETEISVSERIPAGDVGMPVKQNIAWMQGRRGRHIVKVPVCGKDCASARVQQTVIRHHREMQHHLIDLRIAVAAYAEDRGGTGVELCGDFLGRISFRQIVSRPVIEDIPKQKKLVRFFPTEGVQKYAAKE